MIAEEETVLDVCRERTLGWRAERAWHGRGAAWHWLRREGSLTAHLRKLGDVRVIVLFEGFIELRARASVMGGVTPRSAWARDVTLCVDGRPAIMARSLVEAKDSITGWRSIKGLGDSPLATLLYHDTGVCRSRFEYGLLGREHRLFRLARRIVPESHTPRLWARRSVFERQGARLAVAECFLPWLYQEHPVAMTPS
ncbi:chorismate--pyruvate lyase family protein [Cupriavidus pauculus]|uniref:Probable chorismate pyruvate-lyase n=1 Tax=Cupriavidus pauculus TaxID=82633 RepID=A0A2N5C3G9_9BURK|nr:chorismate--pyruvate lyase [Cupriavidus pauculus]